MSTNDTLVLQLIKHLVRKSEETNLADVLGLGENPVLLAKDVQDDIHVRLANRLLAQLSKIDDSLSHLRQQVQTWVNPTIAPNLAQVNGNTTTPKNGAVTVSASSSTTSATVSKQYPSWLLQPYQSMQRLLPNSNFLCNQQGTTSFGVETKDKNIYFYSFLLPDQDTSGDFSSFLHHHINRMLFIEGYTDLWEVVINLERTIVAQINEVDFLAKAHEVKFVVGKIDKAQAKLHCIHSGLSVQYVQDETFHPIPPQYIALGKRETPNPQVYTMPIKRNTQFYITNLQEKGTVEEFAKNHVRQSSKEQFVWWQEHFAKQQNMAMLFSFGF